MSDTWVTRWRLEVSPKPVLPGVWKIRGGGYVASAQVPDPLHPPTEGERPKYKTLFRVMREAQTAKDALDWLEAERKRLRYDFFDPIGAIPLWKDFAVSVLERKIAVGDIQSAMGVVRWRRRVSRTRGPTSSACRGCAPNVPCR